MPAHGNVPGPVGGSAGAAVGGSGVPGEAGSGAVGSRLLTTPWCPIRVPDGAPARRSAHTRGVNGAPPPLPGADDRDDVHRRQLLRLADALAWSLEPQAVAEQLVEAACSTLGAPQGWVAVRSEDGREAVTLAWVGYTEEVIARWRRVPIELDVPMTVVMRTGSGVTHASSRERVLAFPALVGDGLPDYVEASAVVPMVFEGVTIGALAVTFGEVRQIDATARWFLEALAVQGAGALERARLFDAVRRRDDRLTLALEASGTWIWEWDVAANRVTWTPEPPGFVTGVADGAPAGDWVTTVLPEDRPRVQAALDACVRDDGAHEVEFRVGRPGEPPRWLVGIGRLLASQPGDTARVIGTTRDITERKEAEIERNRRLDAEREAARLRDAFISVASHELRTPITTIFGGTRVLSRRWREMAPDARDALLADVSGEADRLFRLVEDLLVLTRVERGVLDVGDEPVALRPLVERVVASERVRSPEVGFEARIPPDLPSADGEETYVEQVLRNLLDNAAKYGGAGSRVVVEAAADGDTVVLRVMDEGPGVRASEEDRLFELFYRSPATAPTVAGAGIGLFVCRQLALAMGGSIRARNRPGGGASFELALRRAVDDGDA